MMRDDATQRQVEAADPGYSTWLSANAGSGKTRVLTDRVAWLLLEEVSPQNILCLTYTKAAAAEMQNRLFKRLGAWAMMPDADLREELTTLGVDRQTDGVQLAQARTLFARAIEAPGGLKIQTIHSFCAGVLRRFPLEAQVSPQFREMEERDAELLRADVVDGLVMGPKADVVQQLLQHFTGDDLGKFTAEIAKNSDDFQNPMDEAALRQKLDLPAGLNAQRLCDDVFDSNLLEQLAAACAAGSANDVKAANALNGLLHADAGPNDVLKGLEDVFLTKSGKAPFTAKIGTFPTKATRNAHPDLIADVEVLMGRVEDIRPLRLGLIAFEKTSALYHFAQAFLPAYADRKLTMGALDFDDLIRKSKALLTDPRVAQWVLFRLDGGIDHILVDEAQDTSPTQWAVIKQLTQEFATGEGARADRDRTVFVVGDKKQSIYSFQGADPAAFDGMKGHFQAAHEAIGKPFNVTSLDHSFRSSQAILSVVDATFQGDRAAGMDECLNHIAFKNAMPGRVDLWPVVEKSKEEEDRLWYEPVDLPSATDHTVIMAQRVASQIKYMIANDTIPVEVENTGTYLRRPITEGDFLILVQRRSELFSEIIRACKAADLKIAGADRLRVGAELAVKDLAALLSFLALPEDDLSLAAALRSPLFDWSEQALFTLAHYRAKDSYLWTALRGSAHSETLAIINDLRGQADFLRPYDLIERILTRHDGRRRLLARLGPEAEDGIDALLSQARAYESTGVPSLTGFLTWMETDDLEIKRQMDSQGDRIRVMTVHGAKGLEAPIVILPDTAKRDNQAKQEILPAGDYVIWKTPTNASAPAVAALRDNVVTKQARERMRLLYVAMTRAEKWLIVGAAGDVGGGDASWYNIVADGLAQRGDFDAMHGELAVRRVAEGDWDRLDLTIPDQKPTPQVTPPIFDKLAPPAKPKTIAPSELGGARVLPGDPAEVDEEDAKARGTQIHRLLEHLPMAPPEERHSLGLQLIQSDDSALVDEIRGLLDQPGLQWLWTDEALREVDITADLPGIGRIHGAIDRLIVGPDKVTAIDYKSNRIVPKRPEQTPLGLTRQLGVYAMALHKIYPDHNIEVAILWTHTGDLMVLPDDLLHEAMIDVATP
jgi:ATP-dependent helicase/nuclease subunit A